MISDNAFLEKPIVKKSFGRFIYGEYKRLIKETFENLKTRIVTMKGMFPIHSLEEFIIFYASSLKEYKDGMTMLKPNDDNIYKIDFHSTLDWSWRSVLVCKAISEYAHANDYEDFNADLNVLRQKQPFFYDLLRKYMAKKNFDLSMASWEFTTFMCELYNRYLGYLVFIQKASNFLNDYQKDYYQYALHIHVSKYISLHDHFYMDFVDVFGINMIILAVELCFFTKKKIIHSNKSMFCSVWLYRTYLEKIGSDGNIYFDVVVNIFRELQTLYIARKSFTNAEYIVYLFPGRPEFSSFGDPMKKKSIETDIKNVKADIKKFKEELKEMDRDYKKYYFMSMLTNPHHTQHIRIEGYS